MRALPKYIKSLVLRVFPEYDHPGRVFLIKAITWLLIKKREFASKLYKVKYRLMRIFRSAVVFEHTWRYAWSIDNVYSKVLFLKWGSTISPYLKRSLLDLPKSDVKITPKLCLVARPGSSHFTEPVLRGLRNSFEIYYQPYFSTDFLQEANGYDIIWFEWGTGGWFLNQLGVVLGAIENKRCTIVIRIHDYELNRSDILKNTNWRFADAIIFINQEALIEFSEFNEYKDGSLYFLPNVVNENAFTLKKPSNFSHINILINCIRLSERKGINKAISLFESVYEKNQNFTLTIRTTNLSSKADIQKLQKNISENKKIRNVIKVLVNDESGESGLSDEALSFDIGTNYSVARMYHDYDVIWSTSEREGFHYAIAEGMLTGLLPVVIDWDWGKPRDFWGSYVAKDDLEFVNKTLDFIKLGSSQRLDAMTLSREYVIKKFGLTKGSGRYVNLFLNLIKRSERDHVINLAEERKKRVIFFAHNHLYSENPRGGEHSSAEILRGLRKNGYECLVLVQNRKSKKLERLEYDEGITSISVPGETFRYSAKEVMLWWQPDVALVWEFPTLDIWDICKSRGIPYVIFIRFWHITAPPPYVDLLQENIAQDFIRERFPIFENAFATIANANDTASVIERLYKRKSIVSYVPVQKLLVLEDEKKYITLINPVKTMGAESLIYDIAEMMPDLEFKVIQGIESMVKSDNVVHEVYCESEYNYLFRDTKVLIFPFKGHPCGTGRVVFECYNLGIPVIGSKSGGLPEVIPHEFIIDGVNDPRVWVAKIRKVLKNYDHYSKKVQKIPDAFSYQDQMAVIYDVVDDAIRSHV